jgi:hypothetical protein
MGLKDSAAAFGEDGPGFSEVYLVGIFGRGAASIDVRRFHRGTAGCARRFG